MQGRSIALWAIAATSMALVITSRRSSRGLALAATRRADARRGSHHERARHNHGLNSARRSRR